MRTDQARVYGAVSDALIEEGYEDLLTGEPEGVRDALRQMIADAEQMATRAAVLQERLDVADEGG